MNGKQIKAIAVYCGSHTPAKKIYTETAELLGKLLAANNITLVFGGSACGTMKVIADSVIENNGKVIGVFPSELSEDLLHKGLSEVHYASNLAERKEKMLELADGIIALPGSIGTWDELFDALATCKISGGSRKIPAAVLNIDDFYTPLKQLFLNSVEAGFSAQKDKDLLFFADNLNEISDFFKLDIEIS